MGQIVAISTGSTRGRSAIVLLLYNLREYTHVQLVVLFVSDLAVYHEWNIYITILAAHLTKLIV